MAACGAFWLVDFSNGFHMSITVHGKPNMLGFRGAEPLIEEIHALFRAILPSEQIGRFFSRSLITIR